MHVPPPRNGTSHTLPTLPTLAAMRIVVVVACTQSVCRTGSTNQRKMTSQPQTLSINP